MRNPFRRKPPVVNLNEAPPVEHQLELARHEIEILKAEIKELRANPEHIVVQDRNAEAKLQAVYRLLSGEDQERVNDLIKQIGNRMGLSSPTVDSIYARAEALQSLAVTKDQIAQRLNSIDIEDISFLYAEDLDAFTEAQRLASS